MVRTCSECGDFWSPYEPVKTGNKLMICTACLKLVCEQCARRLKLIGKIRCPTCKGKLRELDSNELD